MWSRYKLFLTCLVTPSLDVGILLMACCFLNPFSGSELEQSDIYLHCVRMCSILNALVITIQCIEYLCINNPQRDKNENS